MICARLAWSASGAGAKRAAHLEDHKRFLRSGALDILQSGPLFDADGEQIGALVVAEVANLETMRLICVEDPFAKHGIYDRMTFMEWRITVGKSF